MLRLIVQMLAVAVMEVLAAIGLLLQWAPSLLAVGWRLIVMVVTLTGAAYRAVLEAIAQRLNWPFLLRQLWRTVYSVALSLGIVSVVLAVVHWPITVLAVIVSAVHGLVVGLLWDQLGPPSSGQTLGR